MSEDSLAFLESGGGSTIEPRFVRRHGGIDGEYRHSHKGNQRPPSIAWENWGPSFKPEPPGDDEADEYHHSHEVNHKPPRLFDNSQLYSSSDYKAETEWLNHWPGFDKQLGNSPTIHGNPRYPFRYGESSESYQSSDDKAGIE